MITTHLAGILLSASFTLAQQNFTVLCIPGQCLQGYSNTTIGAILSAPGAQTSLHLLPGQYASDTNPQLLHDVLTSSSPSISPSPGFNGSTSLPLNLALQPGIAVYADRLYTGQSGFTPLPSSPSGNSSTPLTARSIALSSNVWIAATTSSNSQSRTIFWDSIPDVQQLPQGGSVSLSLVDIQSSACSPPCSGSSVCTASGTCLCPTGFTGTSCESCSKGFFGPSCQPCPSGCGSCDDGISGSGRCLQPIVKNAPSTCNCLNGICGSNGQCTCNAGFTTAANGTACAKCSSGFFLTSTGDCKVCQLGCTSCEDGTGVCTACKQGFTQDANDRTKCNPPRQATSSGQICPDGSFGGGASCTPCNSACETCTSGSANDCSRCASGTFTLNGACVSADNNGICQGTNLIADNNKRECEACDAKCTSCRIPNFNAASTISQAQCTSCVPGFFLSNGKCLASCPSGTFVSPQDNFTCLPCDQSCSACSGSATFCTSCANNQLAANGKCVASCPSSTFSSSGSCLTCHPDCSTCSGGSFNQCTGCPPERPVLSGGHCLPTCSKTQYFDGVSSTCQSCDSSCSSCSGPGPNNCLACSSSTQVLRTGRCVSAGCQAQSSSSTATVLPGLGVCLSELIDVPQPSGTSNTAPLPTITGLSAPTKSKKLSLEWWQILLMALGCAFIFVVIIWCWRRRARKQRAKKTAAFAVSARFNKPTGGSDWKWRLVRFGEKFFGHKKSKRVSIHRMDSYGDDEATMLRKIRAAEEAQPDANPYHVDGHDQEDMVKLIEGYNHSRSSSPERSALFPVPIYHEDFHHREDRESQSRRSMDGTSRISGPSIYSEVTGIPRRTPEPREPLRRRDNQLQSRFSDSTGSFSLDDRLRKSTNSHLKPGDGAGGSGRRYLGWI